MKTCLHSVSALGAILKYHSEKFIGNGIEHVHNLLISGIVSGGNEDNQDKPATRNALRIFGLRRRIQSCPRKLCLYEF
jgi:hypothetical protein